MGRALEQLPIPFPPLSIPEDHARRARQHKRVLAVLRLGGWFTLAEIAERTSDPEASISARIRGIRRLGHTVSKRRDTERGGTWLYHLES